MRRRWTIGKTRRVLYGTARVLGDVQAVRTNRVPRRIARRAAGKVAGGIFRWLGL